jgi:hypothetical protein
VCEQAPRKLLRLTHPAFVERHVGALQNTPSVAVSLAMTHEQNGHGFVIADIRNFYKVELWTRRK